MKNNPSIWFMLLLVFLAGGIRVPAQMAFKEQEPDYNSVAGPLPEVVSRAGFEQKLNAQLPLDLTFRNEAGEEVRLGDYFKGKKPVILSLNYFECPMLCTYVLNGVTDALKEIPFVPGEQYEIITVSFNPKETFELAASKKKNYVTLLGRDGAEKGWHFLTGNEENIKKLADTVGFTYAWDEKRQEYAHASGIMVATPEGRLSHYFYGVVYSPKDLRLALVESSSGKIGTAVDQLMLFCYHYNPLTGAYSTAVLRFVQVGAILTMVAMGLFLGFSLRREFRTRQAVAG